jgi:hypothetical protein
LELKLWNDMIFVEVPKQRQLVCSQCGSRNLKVMHVPARERKRRDIKGPSGADRVTAARKVGCIANRRAVGSAARVAHEFSRRLTAVIRRPFPFAALAG